MRNVARGSVLLFLAALLMGVFYFQPKVEAVTVLAKDSQTDIQKFDNKNIFDNKEVKLIQDNKGLIESASAIVDNLEEDEEEAAENALNAANGGARTFKATAYCLRGKTASGRSVRRGIVAADPRVLPLGTRIRLSAGKYSGNYLVADTGGRIKGRVLDIWVPSCSEARRWGRRTVKVTVLGKSKKRKRRRG